MPKTCMASVATASAASGATASQKREPRAGRRSARGTSIVATGELTRGVRRDAWPRRSSRPAPGTWGETGTRWWPGSGRGRSPRPDPARRRRPRGRRTTPARVGGTRDRTARTAGSRPRRTDCRAPAWTFAAVMVVYLAWGQAPFLLAMCFTMGGLALLARGRPLLGALPCALGVFTNPLALVAGGIFLLAALVARPAARRGIVVFALAMIPVCTVRIALAAVFAAPSWEYHYMAELGGLTVVALIGIALARRCSAPERRA